MSGSTRTTSGIVRHQGEEWAWKWQGGGHEARRSDVDPPPAFSTVVLRS
jgi:hypothetical protein